MKKSILLAALLSPVLLAGCSQDAEAPEATETAAPTESVAEVAGGLAIDGKPPRPTGPGS
jgi:nitrous oxide reductase accessory protein NosL